MTEAYVGQHEQASLHFHSAIDAADQTGGLCRKRPCPSQPAMLSYYPWFNSRCANLRSQLRLAKQAVPRSPQVGLLGRQYQAVLRHSWTQHNQHQVAELCQLFKSTPCKFWQQGRLPHMLLPPELQHPAAWDSFIAKLTMPPLQHATQLPASHSGQPPAPANSLNQPLTLAEVELALQRLHNGRSAAILGYTLELRQALSHACSPCATPSAGTMLAGALQCCLQHRSGFTDLEILSDHSHFREG
ncbi:hypothetical protein ABBQ32_003835 [Trebouxia sp. C0010 RCD-2024]